MRFTSGIICGSGSFAVQFGDHFRSGDHLRSGIICGAVQIPRRHLSDYVNNCTRKRAARAARLFFLTQLIKSLISGLGVAVVIPKLFAIQIARSRVHNSPFELCDMIALVAPYFTKSKFDKCGDECHREID